MTRAGFLSSYAGYNATSPILRGAFISVYMLGVNPGPPIPGATMMTVTGDFKTQRAYVEALTKPTPCMGCHTAIINPPGFALENYDGDRQVADRRSARWCDRRVASRPPRSTSATARPRRSPRPLQLMQEIAADAEGQAALRAGVGLLRLRARSERQRSMRRRSARHQAVAGRLQHSQSARRSHPGGFLPFASP